MTVNYSLSEPINYVTACLKFNDNVLSANGLNVYMGTVWAYVCLLILSTSMAFDKNL